MITTNTTRTADVEPRDLCWHDSQRMERLHKRYAVGMAAPRTEDPHWEEMDAPEIGSVYIGGGQ